MYLSVTREIRDEVDRVPGTEEPLSKFVEAAVRVSVCGRKDQAAFVARGMSSLINARTSGEYVDASEVMRRLRVSLDSAKPNKRAVLGEPTPFG
ncbi:MULTISPECIES: prevent-host-death protein [unclassified Variovorax]|jgi:hypothetical protein|uniref:prevent-host-death protein n=1 Tax=unclassified Variovorax TaxID=663243 RepID=UPI003ECF37B5